MKLDTSKLSRPRFHGGTSGTRQQPRPAAPAVSHLSHLPRFQVGQEKPKQINAVPLVPPVPPTEDKSNEKAGERGCPSCLHRTPARTCAEPVAAGLAPRFRVVFLSGIGEHGATCAAWQFDASKAAPESGASAPRLTPEQRDRLTGWTGEEIEQAGRYVARLTRRGLDVVTVERVTDRLILRDRERDERRMCLECARLDLSGRCGAAARGALRNADRRLEPLPAILQRCEGFEPLR